MSYFSSLFPVTIVQKYYNRPTFDRQTATCSFFCIVFHVVCAHIWDYVDNVTMVAPSQLKRYENYRKSIKIRQS